MNTNTLRPLLPFANNCLQGVFIERIKRFSVACLVNGEKVWAHTNNSGSMVGLMQKGRPVLLSKATNPNRKLPYTLELVGIPKKNFHFEKSPASLVWVGVNTMTPNALLKAAFLQKQIPWAKGYTKITMEVVCENSRIDALLEGENMPRLWVECKNVTLAEDDVAAFPDSVSTRGHKHLETMRKRLAHGDKAAFFYCVQRSDVKCFAPADYIDPMYSDLFYAGLDAGVAAYPHLAHISLCGISLGPLLPLAPPPPFDV